MTDEPPFDVLEGETCPFCGEDSMSLTETSRDVPYFGICHIFSMSCSSCKYHKADVEAEEDHDPVKYTFSIEGEDDLSVRIIKSSSCDVKIPYVGSIEAGETSNGYITNVEGVLRRVQKQVEFLKESADDKAEAKKAKNLLKKIQKILWGQEKAKIVLEDPSGNSAIVSEKAKKTKLKR